MKKLGIYIHIPFCIQKCRYCDFHSAGLGTGDAAKQAQSTYVQWLIGQIREKGAQYRKKYMVDSVFLGGGTPSILSEDAILAIVGAVRESFNIESDAEITMEANPATLTPRKLKACRGAGINRLSIGVQSFQDEILKGLGRVHSAEEAIQTFQMARKCGFDNINLDLMFAVPNQTMELWMETLDQLIELKPEHVSFYSLQIEEGTPIYEDYLEGLVPFVPEETDREMYHGAIQKLRDAGYHQYEISNAALPGKECRHNLKYWSFEEYLGIGDSASSFLNGVRITEKPRAEYHENDFEDNTSEFVFTGLRKVEGISKSEFQERFGRELWDVFADRKHYLDEFFESGKLIEEGDRLRLSEEGFDVSNTIMSIFV